MTDIQRDHPLLFIPGPTEVHPDVAAAALTPMIGHRGPEISELLQNVLPRVANLLNTQNSIYPLPCSATGAMEAAVRNAAPGPFLHLVCGAFSARWSQLREACASDGDVLEVPWGRPLDPDDVGAALAKRAYAGVTLVHNETSTGVLNPLAAIARTVREHSDALMMVDTVSSMAAVELRLDDWGVDVCLAGTQKAWALPPGLTICAVSNRALERSTNASGKGRYLDWLAHEKSLAKWQTPTTPPISILFQLSAELDRIDAEGLDARYARHVTMRDQALAWAGDRFPPFAAEGFRSHTLTALKGNGVDLAALRTGCRDRGFVVGGGYGKTKPEVFRIGHMGEITPDLLDGCLEAIDEVLDEMGKGQ